MLVLNHLDGAGGGIGGLLDLMHPFLEHSHRWPVARSLAATLLRVEVSTAKMSCGVIVGAIVLLHQACLAVGQRDDGLDRATSRRTRVVADPALDEGGMACLTVPAKLMLATEALRIVSALVAIHTTDRRTLVRGKRGAALGHRCAALHIMVAVVGVGRRSGVALERACRGSSASAAGKKAQYGLVEEEKRGAMSLAKTEKEVGGVADTL